MEKQQKKLAFLAFAMYFLTGAACLLVGSSLPQLVKMYELPLEKVVLLGSAYALGRFVTVYVTGHLVEKIGPMKVLAIGVILVTIFFIGIPTMPTYYLGLLFAALGGAGMGAQDTVCPVLLSVAYKKNYEGSLSAGQALFGLGCFVTPFLVGVMLSMNQPFYYSYYILVIVPVIMLSVIPFTKINVKEDKEKQGETVQPIYVKNKILAYGGILVVCAAYCAVVNSIGLYTSSYAEYIGIEEANAAFILTIYNVGAVIGALAFIFILRKIIPQKILIMNSIIALFAMVAVLFTKQMIVYIVGLFIAGFFLGVLFSVIVAIATRIGYQRIGVASALVATVAGASDILTPIITGFLVGIFGIAASYYYVILMIMITLLATVVLQWNIKDKKITNQI
jgi:fucose permease